MRYPASVGSTCCLFTDDEGKIITNSSGSVVGTGELYCSSTNWLYNGMGVITTVPAGAKYFYLSLNKYVGTSSTITSDPCDVILHKGSNYASGDSMTPDNAREWIADMETDWVCSDEVYIASGKAGSDEGNLNLYSPFIGVYNLAHGNGESIVDLGSKGIWT
jgi:hypothetical protein